MAREIIDPHMHFWDCVSNESGHNANTLGGIISKYPVYVFSHYMDALKDSGVTVKKVRLCCNEFYRPQAVYVEAIADDVEKEAHWAHALISKPEVASSVKFAVVAGGNMTDPKFEELLLKYVSQKCKLLTF
jgi:predicted TIM-barrel fold metal-dependent hydrolase